MNRVAPHLIQRFGAAMFLLCKKQFEQN